jgi:hypothetical protein
MYRHSSTCVSFLHITYFSTYEHIYLNIYFSEVFIIDLYIYIYISELNMNALSYE